jgi:hypothetical protein
MGGTGEASVGSTDRPPLATPGGALAAPRASPRRAAKRAPSGARTYASGMSTKDNHAGLPGLRRPSNRRISPTTWLSSNSAQLPDAMRWRIASREQSNNLASSRS